MHDVGAFYFANSINGVATCLTRKMHKVVTGEVNVCTWNAYTKAIFGKACNGVAVYVQILVELSGVVPLSKACNCNAVIVTIEYCDLSSLFSNK